MQRNIQQITQQFVDQLPANNQYYQPDELRSRGFPSFLVERIKIELERNLDETLVIPKTDWANTQTETVQNAWQKFVDAIQAKVRLPASYGKAVIETAVADIMEMLVQPRKNIPEIIFGQDDQLSYEQVCERVKSVVVYRHFTRLIPRYMQKKELETLTKSRCRKIISTADEKLISRYSPLNWAQMLEPIFKLVGGEIDTNLLRLFFEDKNMPRVARKFDLMNDNLTRAKLIEVLSSPELLNFEGYKDDQSTLFEDQPPSRSTEQESSGLNTPGKNSAEANKNSERPVDTGNQKYEDDISEEDSLNTIFKDQDENAVETGETAPEQTEVSPKDEALADQESQEKQSTATDAENRSAPEKVAPESKEELPQDDEKPIWMRFMSDEEIEEYERKKKQEEQADEVEEGFIDDPIIDLTDEDASDEEINNLRNRLSGDRDFFVEKIFRGSERAFDEAVENIATYDNWREASKYIEQEIYKRNHVDVYSEAAVSFTDQLQNYFFEK